MKVLLDEGAYMPLKAHRWDAGYDLRSPISCAVRHLEPCVIDTGVHIEIPQGYVGMLKSKSGLNVRHDLTGEGVIDSGYSGSIRVKLYNNGLDSYEIRRGDKIIQLVLLPIITPELELVSSLDEFISSERGSNGFGSTGR